MTLATGLMTLALLQADATSVERTLSVTAVDESGAPVQGLSSDEVAVLENGVAREATRFDLLRDTTRRATNRGDADPCHCEGSTKY